MTKCWLNVWKHDKMLTECVNMWHIKIKQNWSDSMNLKMTQTANEKFMQRKQFFFTPNGDNTNILIKKLIVSRFCGVRI